MIESDNLVFMGIGFILGVVVCLLLVRLGFTAFSNRLKGLSDQALIDNSSRFMSLAQTFFTGYAQNARQDFEARGDQVMQRVEPVRQAIEKYNEHLNIMERERDKAFGAIYNQLTEMAKTQQQLETQTGNLVKALRVPHVRGRWGELTLRRVAEISGMAAHCDFVEQAATGGGEGALRPDMVVTLPGNRQIIVDAKVSLSAYLDALEAGDEETQRNCLDRHARHVAAHITMLASKQYHAQWPSSPEFTVLFIPGENYFSAALARQPDLIEKGIEKGVILSTPATLIAMLKAVSYSWKQQQGYENAQKIRDLGVELYQRLGTMSGHMNRLGKDIQKCVDTYNRTVGAMETRVLASARKFEAFGITSEKTTPLKPLDDDPGKVKTMHEKSPDE